MISIIIPIYNGEKYIDRCMKVLSNIKENVEIILINDGSTDNTKKKLQKYKSRSNITIINQKNSGVSNARNMGIQIAKGDYIMFCDIDDYYDENVIPTITRRIIQENPDLLIFGRKDIQGNKLICKYPIEKITKTLNNIEYLEKFFCNGNHTYSVCNKVYKRSIIKRYNIKFNSQITLSEDTLFNLEYISHCKIFLVEQNCYYMRQYNEGSTIFRKNINFYWDNTKIIKIFTKSVEDENLYCKAIQELYKHYIIVSIDRICRGIDKQNFVEDVKNIKKILLDMKNKKIRMHEAKGLVNKTLYILMNTKQSILIYIVFSYIRNKYSYFKRKKIEQEGKIQKYANN